MCVQIDEQIYFKELARAIVRLDESKSDGVAGRLGTQAGIAV